MLLIIVYLLLIIDYLLLIIDYLLLIIDYLLLIIDYLLLIIDSVYSYTKPKGQLPDYATPVVLHQGHSSVEDLCNNIHKSIMKEFK